MHSNRLELKIPTFDELNYRKKLLADPETMIYNRGFNDSDGYDKETGCIKFGENSWKEWYSCWIDNIPDRYYAYIFNVDNNIPIGEVALRYVKEKMHTV